MQQRQRVGDLEEEVESLKKQLRTTQTKVAQQVKDLDLRRILLYTYFLVSRNWKFKSIERYLRCTISDF
jgi:hypothetical protein